MSSQLLADESKKMVTGLSSMACGGCGHSLFRIFQKQVDYGFELHCECQGCKSTSIVRPSKPVLEIEWGEGDGRLTRMDPTAPIAGEATA